MYERRRGETGPHIDFVPKQPRWDSAHHERLPKGVTPDPKPGPTLTPTLTPAPLPAVSLASQSMLKPSSSLKPSDSPAAGGQLLAGEHYTPMSACSHYNLVSALQSLYWDNCASHAMSSSRLQALQQLVYVL